MIAERPWWRTPLEALGRRSTATIVGTAVLVGLASGAAVVALAPATSDPTIDLGYGTLEALDTLTTADFVFAPAEIRVAVGEVVALRLQNEDPSAHSFDVDEFDIHAPMPASGEGLVLFRPAVPRTYTFYCGIPGHADLARGTGMIGTLVIEP